MKPRWHKQRQSEPSFCLHFASYHHSPTSQSIYFCHICKLTKVINLCRRFLKFLTESLSEYKWGTCGCSPKQNKQAPSLQSDIGNQGLAVLKKLDIEKSVDLGLYHPLEIKADRLQDLHAFKLHDLSAGAGIDFSDSAFSEDQMLHLVIELEVVRRASPRTVALMYSIWFKLSSMPPMR